MRIKAVISRVILAAAGAVLVAGCTWEIPNDSNVEMAPLVRIAEVGPQPRDGRRMVTEGGGRVAYVRATPDAADRENEHIFIETAGRTWQLFGLPYEGKPLENLHWEGEELQALVVDRWFAPTQGVRVYVDMRTGAVFYAMPLSRPPEDAK